MTSVLERSAPTRTSSDRTAEVVVAGPGALHVERSTAAPVVADGTDTAVEVVLQRTTTSARRAT
ncbi:hypothetical protein ACI782_22970 [Geodermatophilus sp. SYSU D00703]